MGTGKEWRSVAVWPAGTISGRVDNRSEDLHDTQEQALAVCRGLLAFGFGGDGVVFPAEVFVEHVAGAKLVGMCSKRYEREPCPIVVGEPHVDSGLHAQTEDMREVLSMGVVGIDVQEREPVFKTSYLGAYPDETGRPMPKIRGVRRSTKEARKVRKKVRKRTRNSRRRNKR